MVRTAVRGGHVPSDAGRRRDKRPNEQTFVGHPEYKDRLKKKRSFIFERGIALEQLKETPIHVAVEARGWAGYVRRPCNANISLIHKFYANMVDTQFDAYSVVIVRGVPVVVSMAKINEYYDLPPIERLEDAWPNRFDIGCALRRMGAAG